MTKSTTAATVRIAYNATSGRWDVTDPTGEIVVAKFPSEHAARMSCEFCGLRVIK